jgi:hypothetical protein
LPAGIALARGSGSQLLGALARRVGHRGDAPESGAESLA